MRAPREGRERERDTFNTPQFLAEGDKVSPFHVTPSYKPQYLFRCEHGHALQVFTIDTIFSENLAVTTQIYLLQP